MMCRSVLLPVAAVVLLIGGLASNGAGHGVDQPPAADAVLLGAEGVLIGAGTNFGLVLRDGNVPRWTPEESLDVQRIHDWWADDAEKVFAATSEGLHVTTNGGCSWQPVRGPLAEDAVLDLAGAEGRLVASTGSGGGDNGVFVGDLQTGRWSTTGIAGRDVLFERLVLADGTIWVEGFDRKGRRWRVWRAEFDGMAEERAWTSVTPRDPNRSLRLAGGSGGRIYLAQAGESAEGDMRWSLIEMASSSRQAASGEVLLNSETRPLEVAHHETGIFVRTEASTRSLADESVAGGIEARCLKRRESRHEESELWACRSVLEAEGLVSRHTNSHNSWREYLKFREIRRRDCPAGTPGARLIPQIWPAMRNQGVGPVQEDATNEERTPNSGCGGCRAADSSPPFVWSGFLWLLAAATVNRKWYQ